MMETLPVEVMCKIGSYLPVEDLNSCILVSSFWRDVFGSDEVWRPRCDEDSEEYLRKTPCQVDPKFTSPQSDNSTLRPIGRWRIAYMREAHLWRNWISGNFVKDEICSKVSYCDADFLNNDFVVIDRVDHIELIDTTVKPSVCRAKLDKSSRFYGPKVARSDMFIMWSNGDVFKVVEVDLQAHALSVKHIFCLSEDDYINDFILIDSVLVGMSNYHRVLQIWNLENGSKLKAESCFLPHGYFHGLYCSKNCQDIIVTVEEDNDDIHCFVYSLKELRFLSFTTQISTYTECAIVKGYVAFSFDSSLKVYNYENSKLLHDIPLMFNYFDCDSLGPRVSAQRDNFMFINDNKELMQLSPSTGVCSRLLSGIRSFNCISEKLIRVLFHQGNTELWKVGSVLPVRTLVAPYSCSRINQVHSTLLNTKVYPIDKVVCIHLWYQSQILNYASNFNVHQPFAEVHKKSR